MILPWLSGTGGDAVFTDATSKVSALSAVWPCARQQAKKIKPVRTIVVTIVESPPPVSRFGAQKITIERRVALLSVEYRVSGCQDRQRLDEVSRYEG